MFLAHYLLPFIVYYFHKSKVMLWGLLIGNIIDLDHVYSRLIGEVPWFESACPGGLGTQCSFGLYPLHSLNVAVALVVISIILFFIMRKNKKTQIWFWIAIGALLNLLLDYIHLITGFGF